MIISIIKKEWLKLKFYFLAFIILSLASAGYFWFNLDFSFHTIEPESMMWYRFVHLEDKPYFYLSYIFLGFGIVTALVQYLPERIRDRIKIMAHLPLELKESLFYHLFVGSVFIAVLSTLFGIFLLNIIILYYPDEIVKIALKDTIAYSFLSISTYLALSSVILEKKPFFIVLKFILTVMFIIIFLKHVYYIEDTIWLLFLIFIPFAALDSFYSIKQQRLNSLFFKISGIIVIIWFIYSGFLHYKQNYQKIFNKYYIFYSNIADEFVYQKNFGDHRFEYGIKDKKVFNKDQYESYLPFVYWRNLDIQNKLPVVIDGKKFDKDLIKMSRLGFSYAPEFLKKNELELYPLLNPQSKKGMIKFPEEMFTVNNKGFLIYDFDNGLNSDLSTKATIALKEEGFMFPARNIWGKPTNMKPYDKGYLILDNNKKLFNLKRENGKIIVSGIKYPRTIDLEFIRISENRQKIISGYALDSNSGFYLLDRDFNFIKLDLDNFNHKTMKLKFIANPINYLIRYDDGENYYAAVFNKGDMLHNNINLIKIKDIHLN